MPNRYITWVFNHGRAIVSAIFNDNKRYLLILNSKIYFIIDYQLITLLYIQRKKFQKVTIG
jgi:hypothetical protein